MEGLRVATLVLSTVSVGLVAGVFFGWAVSVMPGLARVDARTFVSAFHAMDRAIVRAPFVSVFLGGLLLTAAANLLHSGADHRGVLPWTAAAFLLYLLSFIFTIRINIPINNALDNVLDNALKSAGGLDALDVAAVRERFAEARWTYWNNVRAVLCTLALVCLAVALAL